MRDLTKYKMKDLGLRGMVVEKKTIILFGGVKWVKVKAKD